MNLILYVSKFLGTNGPRRLQRDKCGPTIRKSLLIVRVSSGCFKNVHRGIEKKPLNQRQINELLMNEWLWAGHSSSLSLGFPLPKNAVSEEL